MNEKKTLLIAQLCITCMMAFSMSGIMGLLVMGPTAEWLHAWPRQFITAWPIAFILTLFVGRIGFAIAHRVVRATS
jgi:sulfite exporter TauE/SafE